MKLPSDRTLKREVGLLVLLLLFTLTGMGVWIPEAMELLRIWLLPGLSLVAAVFSLDSYVRQIRK